MKSKYNTGDSIDINSLPESERKIAFREWAEGSEALERLLNTGYEKGFLSWGCCSGDSGVPHISYELKNDYSRKMAIYIAKDLLNSGLDCEFFFDDTFSFTEVEYKEIREHLLKTFPEDFSEETYSPVRSITTFCVVTRMDNVEEVFGRMSDIIKEAKSNDIDDIQLPRSSEEVPSRNFDKTTTITVEQIGQIDVSVEAKRQAGNVLAREEKTLGEDKSID